mgnify:CR=1 FL=1
MSIFTEKPIFNFYTKHTEMFESKTRKFSYKIQKMPIVIKLRLKSVLNNEATAIWRISQAFGIISKFMIENHPKLKKTQFIPLLLLTLPRPLRLEILGSSWILH